MIKTRMATIARARVPVDEFALAETVAALTDVEFDVERIVESAEDTVMPLLWVRGAEADAVTAAFADDPSVGDVSLLSAFDDKPEQLYHMEWVSEIALVVQMLTHAEATIMTAFCEDGSWYLRMLYPSRDALTETVEYCEANGLTFEIQSIHEMEGDPANRYGLSEFQHNALTAAVEMGYYKVPREITMREMATEFDVSHQALSERLRRAVDTLVANTVLVGPPDEE